MACFHPSSFFSLRLGLRFFFGGVGAARALVVEGSGAGGGDDDDDDIDVVVVVVSWGFSDTAVVGEARGARDVRGLTFLGGVLDVVFDGDADDPVDGS